MDKVLGLNTTLPTEEVPQTVENITTEPQVTQTETPPVTQTATPTVEEPPKVSTFFDTFNKTFGTQYKSDDELKGLLDTPKKVADYETRLKDYEDIKKSAEDRQRKIDELEGLNDPLKFFSSPDAFIAEQLRIKNPDKDAVLLYEIATTDVSKMGDFDVLVKAMKMFIPNLPNGGAGLRDVLYEKYGIDPEIDPKDWDDKTKTKIAIDAAMERNRISDFKKGIEMPKVISKEEREKFQAETLAKRQQSLSPVKEQFTKFEKFQHEEFEYDVPAEYKEKSAEMFDGMFIDAGLEMNEENLKTAIQLRNSNFLLENFGKIKEVIIKQAETALRAKIDEELHNTTPPNTATATDQNTGQELPGIGNLISTLKNR
jgi:hypothetical protein